MTTSTPSRGAILRARREALGLSQTDLAQRVGTSQSEISKLESDAAYDRATATLARLELARLEDDRAWTPLMPTANQHGAHAHAREEVAA